MPVRTHHYFDDKSIEPLALERQPFSNLINYMGHSNHYANPLEKINLKQAFRSEHTHNLLSHSRYPDRKYVDESFGIEEENINI